MNQIDKMKTLNLFQKTTNINYSSIKWNLNICKKVQIHV
jgi:hypothetical protein